MMFSDRAPQPGDWVLVWAQVEDADPHPENYFVEFHSHNESWSGIVRRDRVLFPNELPPDVEACAAMFTEPGNSSYYVRCTLHHRHHADHRDIEGRFYEDREVVGYFEAK